jgi:hypothetical protein
VKGKKGIRAKEDFRRAVGNRDRGEKEDNFKSFSFSLLEDLNLCDTSF